MNWAQAIKVLRIHLICSMLLVFLTSCGGLLRDNGPEAVASATAVRGVLATAVPKPISTPLPVVVTATASVVPVTVVPTATDNHPLAPVTVKATEAAPVKFSRLHFSLTAEGEAQSEFPAGTIKIYAVWDYKDMAPGDNVRRIWFRDDQIWITRSEEWEWDEYGSEGTMRDISIFDNEGSGLLSATYRLQLYVNDELQEEGTFIIHTP